MNPDTPFPQAPKLVYCPSCKAEVVYTPSNPFRPFCNQRCKEIDLGAWASENFRLPETEAPEASLTEPASLPASKLN